MMSCLSSKLSPLANAKPTASRPKGRGAVNSRGFSSQVYCLAGGKEQGSAVSRRAAIEIPLLAAGTTLLSGPAFADKTPKGFVGFKDKGDGYQFFYPFGWQEVSVPGQDVVIKDVIEPLEVTSVNLKDTDKKSVTEYGEVTEVCYTLADQILSPPDQPIQLLQAKEEEYEGNTYYKMEFTVKAPNFTRHALAVVTVNNGKFYTFATGCNERRWNKLKSKLLPMASSFSTFPVVV
uniref:Photosystem II oxygen-evolving enhancer protein 2 n=1 Tax=Tetraselmis sp. GSL018 TaxID=582737 RepID=A0A061S642_9CHLO|mmetsp:Transcript_10324/g.24588  ORF Transcript_10324/g.24588 Transcript_10324/m.24588 type:complete len:234 (+) Transcript_10324:137-838(+)